MWTIASLTRDGTLGRSFRYLGNACLNRIRLQIVKHENDYWYFSGQLMGRKVFWPEWNEGLWWQTFDKYAFWCEISCVSILHCLFKRLSETTFFSASALWNPMWMNESYITQIPFLTIPNDVLVSFWSSMYRMWIPCQNWKLFAKHYNLFQSWLTSIMIRTPL